MKRKTFSNDFKAKVTIDAVNIQDSRGQSRGQVPYLLLIFLNLSRKVRA